MIPNCPGQSANRRGSGSCLHISGRHWVVSMFHMMRLMLVPVCAEILTNCAYRTILVLCREVQLEQNNHTLAVYLPIFSLSMHYSLFRCSLPNISSRPPRETKAGAILFSFNRRAAHLAVTCKTYNYKHSGTKISSSWIFCILSLLVFRGLRHNWQF